MTPLRRRKRNKSVEAGLPVEPKSAEPQPRVRVVTSDVENVADVASVADVAVVAEVKVEDVEINDIETISLEEIVASEDTNVAIEDTGVAIEPDSTERPTTVIVVGAGSAEGVALVLALTKSGHRVVAVDHDPYAAGLRLATLGAVLPATDHPDFTKALATVVRRSDARRGARPAGRGPFPPFREPGTACLGGSVDLGSPPEVFALCGDLAALDHVLTSSGLPEEKTGLGRAADVPEKRRDFVVDVIVDRDHDLITAVSSWRQVTNGELTTAAETFSDPRLLELLRAVCAAILIEGPVVVEGYEADYRIRLTAIRPGFSPVAPLARAAGVDVVSIALAGALGNRVPPPLLTHRSGVRMLQYLDQVFEG